MDYTEIKKQWSIRNSDVADIVVDVLIDKYKISRAAAEMIAVRCGNTVEGAHNFINKDTCEQRDPFMLKDMNKAVQRILQAIENPNEVIAIYGDYDVDGVTSVSMMYLYLTSLGCARDIIFQAEAMKDTE